MLGLDDALAGLGDGSLLVALGVALLLGLRHATDPDHLTAVATLLASGERSGPRGAGALGLAWGLGHACTLIALALPVLLFHDELPASLQTGLELAVGVLIVALSVRLLVRWRRGYLHVHVHSHGELVHAHPHAHEGASHPHGHEHAHAHSRTPLAAFGIGLLHGAGGSAGVAVLLVAAVPDEAAAVAAVAVLAFGSTIAMAAVSAFFGYALTRGPVLRRFEQAAPLLGVLSLSFGVWYGLGAVQAVPYVL
jgi:ABC-type nickel/cobalt efflux system permease component RcnA